MNRATRFGASKRWWRVVLRWGDRVVADDCVRSDEALHIGFAAARL